MLLSYFDSATNTAQTRSHHVTEYKPHTIFIEIKNLCIYIYKGWQLAFQKKIKTHTMLKKEPYFN